MEADTSNGTLPRPFTKRRIAVIVVCAIVVTGLTVGALIEFGHGNSSRIVCQGQDRLGNVSAWYPLAFVAAPYEGSESGNLRMWDNYTVGGLYHNTTFDDPTSIGSGNVTLGWATGGNWTIFSAINISEPVAGPSLPCTSSMIAFLGPPNGPVSEIWGGETVASGLVADVGLPSSINSSLRCGLINESSDCAVSSIFSLNFTRSSGEVNTCGKLSPATLAVMGGQLAVDIPFPSNGTVHWVPVGPSSENGMMGWFNYTFPADGGIWQYQYLPGISDSTSGLVFSYATCPA